MAGRLPPASPPKWHSHLSALELPTQGSPAASSPVRDRALAEGSEKKAWTGAVLDDSLLERPLAIRSVLSGVYLAKSESSVGTLPENEGRDHWVVTPVEGTGEYTIQVEDEDGCWYLSADQGKRVGLVPEDDGSGRQRWVFKQTGDSEFSIRVAGGKSDDKVYLGVDEDSRVRLYAKMNGRPSLWTAEAVPYCDDAAQSGSPDVDVSDPDDEPEPAAPSLPRKAGPKPSATSHVPARAVQDLRDSFSEDQLNAILQLISLPENGHPRWHTMYGYVEFLGDGRGFTTTIFGACSGTGDLYMVFEELANDPNRSALCDQLLEFKDKLRNKRGDDIQGIEGIKPLIRRLGDDPAWQRAVWKVFTKLYWRFAIDWCDKKGAAAGRPGPVLKLPASRGFMVDTSTNHGANADSLMRIVKRMNNPNSKNEVAWIKDFADARGVDEAHSFGNHLLAPLPTRHSRQRGRCRPPRDSRMPPRRPRQQSRAVTVV